MIDFELLGEFLKANMLVILIPIVLFLFMFVKPFRKILGYCTKNIAPLLFFITLSICCSFFGYTIALNFYSIFITLLLGLPGISLVLFLPLVI